MCVHMYALLSCSVTGSTPLVQQVVGVKVYGQIIAEMYRQHEAHAELA